jgi:hypothetical protein
MNRVKEIEDRHQEILGQITPNLPKDQYRKLEKEDEALAEEYLKLTGNILI